MQRKQTLNLQDYVIFNTVTKDAPFGRDFAHIDETRSKSFEEIKDKCESGQMAKDHPLIDPRIASKVANWIMKEDIDESCVIYATDENGYVKVPKTDMKTAQLINKRLLKIDPGITVSPLGAKLDPIKEEEEPAKNQGSSFRQKLRDSLSRGIGG